MDLQILYRKTEKLGICSKQRHGLHLTQYYVCKRHLGIKLVFQKQHFLYVTSFLNQSMALYFFQDQVQMAQPGIQGSPQSPGFFVSTLQHQPLTLLGLESMPQPKHRTSFLCSPVCVFTPVEVSFIFFLPPVNPPSHQYQT